MVARSSAEAEFRAMTHGICELIWIKIILSDLGIKWREPMKLYCDNKSTISIAHNPVQHDRTKHVEVDWHFIKEKLENGLICTPYIPTKGWLGDILTKGLPTRQFQTILRKLGMRNIYSLAWGGMLENLLVGNSSRLCDRLLNIFLAHMSYNNCIVVHRIS